MFEGKSILEILQIGGFTMYILLFCSLLSVTIFLERIFYYRRRSRTNREEFMSLVKKALDESQVEKAKEICRSDLSPFAKIVHSGLSHHGDRKNSVSNAMERSITIETAKLEKNTSIVGTVGNTAVYIGLFGTGLGIIRAFHDISAAGTGGMNIVIAGVAEALVCTATGLLVAIPAVIVFNYFTKRVEHFVNDMELCASELMDLLGMD
jgi:biopolymer transport protein ExbB